MAKQWAALVILVLFLAVNTLKVAMFDTLLIYPSLSITSCFQLGIFTKFIIVCLLFIVLLRLKKPVLFALFYGLQILYMFANLSYHRASEGYLHVTQYVGLYSEALDLLKHSAIPQNGYLAFLLMDLPLFVGIVLLYPRIVLIDKRFIFNKAPAVFAALLISFLYKWQAADAAQRPMAILNDRYSCDNTVVHNYGLLTYNVIDLLNIGDSKSRINRLDYGKPLIGKAPGGPPADFLLVQVESMDANIVNARHRGEWVTPFLHDLSETSVYYPYVLSFHKAGSTSDCEFSIINSVVPFDDYPAMKLRNYDYPNSILKPLAAAGYELCAFHGNRGAYFNRNIAFKKMGFKTFYDLQAMRLRERGWGACDGDVFDFVIDKVKQRHSPFFYYIITMSSHEPFLNVNAYYKTGRFDDIKDEPTKNYFRSMSYVDGQLERLVKIVSAACPNAFVVIYGDHSPPFIDNVDFKRASFSRADTLLEFVPLFIITPDRSVHKEKLQAALFLDFASTILPASKTGYSIRSSGRDLLAFSKKEAPPACGEETYRRDLFNRICRAKP